MVSFGASAWLWLLLFVCEDEYLISVTMSRRGGFCAPHEMFVFGVLVASSTPKTNICEAFQKCCSQELLWPQVP
jgi:hypothetical protein